MLVPKFKLVTDDGKDVHLYEAAPLYAGSKPAHLYNDHGRGKLVTEQGLSVLHETWHMMSTAHRHIGKIVKWEFTGMVKA